MLKSLMIGLMLFGLAACTVPAGQQQVDLAPLVQALSQDKSALCAEILAPMGTIKLDRNWGCEAQK